MKLECIYFPYADPQPSQEMLAAALLFDTIYFLEPNFFRKPGEVGSNSVDSFDLDIHLKSAGIFKELGPKLMGFSGHRHISSLNDASVREELSGSILADLSNPELIRLSEGYGKLFWTIPNGQYLFWAGLGLLLEVGKNGRVPLGVDVFTERTDFYIDFLRTLHGYDVHVAELSEVRIREPKGELLVRLPFLPVQSLMMSLALHASREFGLIPVTDSTFHREYLNAKLRAAGETANASPDFLASISKGHSYSSLGTESISLAIPRISGLTPEKVVALRERCGDELEIFRIELRKLSHDISLEPWQPNYRSKVQEICDTKIAPALIQVKHSIASLRQELGISIVESTLTAAPIPLLLSIAPGIPMSIALPLSAGIVGAKELVKHYKRRSAVKQNGLSFLLNLGNGVR